MSAIRKVTALEVLDSRGTPTVEAAVWLASGAWGRAIVPSGASTGEREALELRDGDPRRYLGKGVLKAARHAEKLGRLIRGQEAADQGGIDALMCAADRGGNEHGDRNKSEYGANAILAVSMAVARAAAEEQDLPLCHYLARLHRRATAQPARAPRGASRARRAPAALLPVPQLNIVNGGAHADSGLDIQEFMILPLGPPSFAEALRAGVEVFQELKKILAATGRATSVGDEGGFAPKLRANESALELITIAIKSAGYAPRTEVALALDVAASQLWDAGTQRYVFAREGRSFTRDGLIAYYAKLVKKYPIVSIEDGMAEDDHAGWAQLNAALGKRVQIVGDDVFVTNPKLLQQGIREKWANAILIKLNQIGTVSETLETMRMAAQARMSCVVSHRSGETEDDFIAHLAVATGAGQIKTGAPSRSERVAKYNELLRIEKRLGSAGAYAGAATLVGYAAPPKKRGAKRR